MEKWQESEEWDENKKENNDNYNPGSALPGGGGGTLAWYLREDVKQAQTTGAEVMAPYNLYLMNPNAKDSLKFAVGNLHPGEIKHTVICVSNRVPENYDGEDNMSELVKDSEFNYDLQLVHTENLAVDYAVYPLEESRYRRAGGCRTERFAWKGTTRLIKPITG